MKKNIFFYLTLLVVLSSTSYILLNVYNLMSINQIICQSDSFLSEEFSTKIHNHITHTNVIKKQPFQKTASQLQQEFPLINSSSFLLTAPGILHITLRYATPQVLINDTLVFVESGDLFPCSFFQQTALKSLPKLTVATPLPEKPVLQKACKDFIKSIPQELFQNYAITWFSKTKSVLYDKQINNFSVISNNETIGKQELWQSLEKIKQMLQERGFFSDKHLKQLKADMRFNEQIILDAC